MDAFLGFIVGWFTAPYLIIGTLWFVIMFPVLFLGVDISGDRPIKYRFGPVLCLMAITLAALHFTTQFNVFWLFSGGFWQSALRMWLFALSYFVSGMIYAYVRWTFYAAAYAKRILGENPSESMLESYFKNHRLDRKGARLSLIVKWVLYWPWSLLSWAFTDLFNQVIELTVDLLRGVFGKGFAKIARAREPEVMKQYRRDKADSEAALKKAREADDQVMRTSTSLVARTSRGGVQEDGIS